MKFTSYALAASLAAVAHPAPTNGWSLVPMSSSLFFPDPFDTMTSPRSMMQRHRAMMDRMDRAMGSPFQSLAVSSPRYEIVNDDEKFQLAIAVPGLKMEDLNVKVEDNVLTVSGHTEMKKGSPEESAEADKDESKPKTHYYSFTSSDFSQSFSLRDPAIDVDQLTAKLENGVLLVSAPKDMKRLEENVRTIPIAAGHETKQIKLEGSTDKKATDVVVEDGLEMTEEPIHN